MQRLWKINLQTVRKKYPVKNLNRFLPEKQARSPTSAAILDR